MSRSRKAFIRYACKLITVILRFDHRFSQFAVGQSFLTRICSYKATCHTFSKCKTWLCCFHSSSCDAAATGRIPQLSLLSELHNLNMTSIRDKDDLTANIEPMSGRWRHAIRWLLRGYLLRMPIWLRHGRRSVRKIGRMAHPRSIHGHNWRRIDRRWRSLREKTAYVVASDDLHQVAGFNMTHFHKRRLECQHVWVM
jgi:hypothetical protein